MRTGIYQLGTDLNTNLRAGTKTIATSVRRAVNPLLTGYRCADDTWIWLLLLEGDRHWPKLARAMERPTCPRVDRRPTGPRGWRIRPGPVGRRFNGNDGRNACRFRRPVPLRHAVDPRTRPAHRAGAAGARLGLGTHRRGPSGRRDSLGRVVFDTVDAIDAAGGATAEIEVRPCRSSGWSRAALR